jgi:hypothetical protein
VRGEPKRSLFFLHVQKTAGSTLRGILSNRFAARDCLALYSAPDPDPVDLNRARYVTGHLDASVIESFHQPPYVIALLRDPIDRALSAYSYAGSFPPEFQPPVPPPARDPEAPARGRAFRRLARERSLDELIESEPQIAAEYLGNRQARALCGPSARSGEERLDEAIEALERCDYVGIGERLDETADWIARRLGWQEFGALPRANITTAKLRRDQVPAKAMDALRELTAVDRELYLHGLGLFEGRLSEWSVVADPRDPSVDIPDATLVSDLCFDGAITGGGWMGREQSGDRPAFCWIGHTRAAWVDLAGDRAADSLLVEMEHVIDPAVLQGLRISVDGETVPHELREADRSVVAIAPLKRRRLRRRAHARRVTIEVERTMNPHDVDPASLDNRQLSVAVSRIALRP